jgi:hypothetical protein
MTLAIRPYLPEDRAELIELWRRSFEGHADDPAAQLELALAGPSTALFVAREDGSFAGSVRFPAPTASAAGSIISPSSLHAGTAGSHVRWSATRRPGSRRVASARSSCRCAPAIPMRSPCTVISATSRRRTSHWASASPVLVP